MPEVPLGGGGAQWEEDAAPADDFAAVATVADGTILLPLAGRREFVVARSTEERNDTGCGTYVNCKRIRTICDFGFSSEKLK